MKRIRPPASAVAVVVISLLSPQSAHGFHARQPLSSLHRLAGEHQLSQAPAVPSRTLSRSSALKLRRGTRKYDDIGDDEANYYRRKRLGYRSRGAALFGWLPSISVQQFLVAANMTFFALQIASAVSYGPVLNAVLLDSGYSGPTLTGTALARRMLTGATPLVVTGRDPASRAALIRATSLGPLTMDLVHQRLLTGFQPHRLITAGFLHGSLIHLLFNMRYLWKMPKWLEEGLGRPIYIVSYLGAIIGGNLAHSYTSPSTEIGLLGMALGASGGICGLNGLMWVMLKRMGNKSSSGAVFSNMLWLVLFGYLTEGISNAGHIGGFVGGAIIGFLFGPRFGSSYSMKRKWSVAVDEETPEFRSVLGFGVEPKKAIFGLKYLVVGLLLASWMKPNLRLIPLGLGLAVRKPGFLSALKMSA